MSRFSRSPPTQRSRFPNVNGAAMDDSVSMATNLMAANSTWRAKKSSSQAQLHDLNSNQTTLNDLNPKNSSSQLQYSPTMSLKGNKSANKVNIMASPVQIKLSEPDYMNEPKNSKSAKAKKNGKNEMVFVNYSVQDTTETLKKKKQSKRDRMLRIFTGSSTPDSKPMTLQSTPTSAAKRTYGSFLKCHKLTNTTFDPSPVEVVPKSEPIPNGQKPPVTRSVSSNVSLVQSNGRCSLTNLQLYQKSLKNETLDKMDLLKYSISTKSSTNVSLGLNSKTKQHPNLLEKAQSTSNIELKRIPTRPSDGKSSVQLSNAMRSSISNAKTNMDECNNEDEDEDDFDHHYLEPYHDFEHISSAPSLQQSDDTSDSLLAYPTDENDASVAFSKLFTRKRTNTGGSMSSLLSASASQQPVLGNLDRNLSSNSVASSFRYSPIRSGSQCRTRSNTRTSNHRLSRDLTGLQLSMKQSSSEVSDLLGMESYLDTQPKMRLSHRKKQESISDIGRSHSNYTNSSTSMSSSASTPETNESGLVQFPVKQMFSLQREIPLAHDFLDDENQLYFKTMIKEDEEYESGVNTSASSSRMGISSTTTISSRSTAIENSGSNSYCAMGDNIDFKVKTGALEPTNGYEMNNQTSTQNKHMIYDHNNELFNNYLDFNFEDVPVSTHLFTDGSTVLHQVFNGSNNDTSTITSGMNVSPITVTGANTSQDEVTTIGPSNLQNQTNNLSFQTRIMNDIDRLAHGFNLVDYPNEEH